MDRLTCMHTFVNVVETGNFSSAGRKLGISKTLVSKYVAQLENSLDVLLLHRTTRRVSLTEIAAYLGYSELSAFTRAYTRQTGTCPSEWRAEIDAETE